MHHFHPSFLSNLTDDATDRASGHFRGPVPWGDIIPRITEFLDAEYLPEGFKLISPDHLRVRDCSALLKHLLARQKEHGVGPRVFSWKCFAQKEKGKGIVATPALIAFDDQDETDATALLAHSQLHPPTRRKGRGMRKQAGKGGEDIASDSGMESPSDVDWIDHDGQTVNKLPHDAQDSDEESIRSFNWMLAAQQRTISGAEGEPDDADLTRRQGSGRRSRQVLDSDDDPSDAEEVPTPGISPVKPTKKCREEVDPADVITAPRVRKESARVRDAAQAQLPAAAKRPAAKRPARKPAAPKPAAPKPAVQAGVAKRSKSSGTKITA